MAAKKTAKSRQQPAALGRVVRSGGGEVQMIEFSEYRASGTAVTAFVNKVGGIYRLDTTLIKVTFTLESPGSGGRIENVERVNLLWNVADWIAAGDTFRFAMSEVAKGSFIPDDGGGRRARHQ